VSTERELREAIEDYDVNIGLDQSAVAYDGIIQALDAAPDGPQMDRLVEWLEEKRTTPANTPGDRGWESAFTVVLHHIDEMQEEQP